MKDLSHAATLNSTYVPKHNMRLVAKLSVEGKKDRILFGTIFVLFTKIVLTFK